MMKLKEINQSEAEAQGGEKANCRRRGLKICGGCP
jgi:hypothetical protein